MCTSVTSSRKRRGRENEAEEVFDVAVVAVSRSWMRGFAFVHGSILNPGGKVFACAFEY